MSSHENGGLWTPRNCRDYPLTYLYLFSGLADDQTATYAQWFDEIHKRKQYITHFIGRDGLNDHLEDCRDAINNSGLIDNKFSNEELLDRIGKFLFIGAEIAHHPRKNIIEINLLQLATSRTFPNGIPLDTRLFSSKNPNFQRVAAYKVVRRILNSGYEITQKVRAEEIRRLTPIWSSAVAGLDIL